MCVCVSDKLDDGTGSKGAAPPALCPPEGAAPGLVSGSQSTQINTTRRWPCVHSDYYLPGELEKICEKQVCVTFSTDFGLSNSV